MHLENNPDFKCSCVSVQLLSLKFEVKVYSWTILPLIIDISENNLVLVPVLLYHFVTYFLTYLEHNVVVFQYTTIQNFKKNSNKE